MSSDSESSDRPSIVAKVFMYIIGALVMGIGISMIAPYLAEAINSGEGDTCHGYRAMAVAKFCIVLLVVETLTGIVQIITTARMSSTSMKIWVTVHWMLFLFDIVLLITWAVVLSFKTPRESVAEGIMLSVIVVLKLIYAILLSFAGTHKSFDHSCC